MSDVVLAFQCPKCAALVTRALVGPKPTGKCSECNETSDPSAWGVGHWREAPRTTDTTSIPGDIVGPDDDPFAEDSVIVDTRNAVHLDYSEVTLVTNPSDGREICAALMSGRINQSTERSRVVYLLSIDGMAALVAQIAGLAARRGGEFGDEFGTLLTKRLEEMPKKSTEGEG